MAPISRSAATLCVPIARWMLPFGSPGTTPSVHDLGERLVVGDHADHDVAAPARLDERARDFRAGLLEIRALRARAVVDDELVTAAEHACGHGLTHSAEADETYLHLRSSPDGAL